MTFEDLLEEWNSNLSDPVTKFLNHLGYNHPKLARRVLDYGIGYADYFDNDEENTNTELLKFLKAICLWMLFLRDEDEDTAVPIDSENGRLWERSISSPSLSTNHKRLVRLTLDKAALEEILQPLNCLKEQEQDSIHDTLFKRIRDQLTSTQHAATAMRYVMEKVLIEEAHNEKRE